MSIRPQDGAPSFNRPALVRYDSLRDSKDLGPITDIKAQLSGFIGAEAGSQSLFFSFTLLVPGAIQVQTITESKWTGRFVSVGLRSDTGAIGLDERGNARGIDIVNTSDVDEALTLFPPGRYTVVVGCSQWQTTPFGLILRVNPTTRLYANLTGRGGLGNASRLRIATARLEGSVGGRGSLGSPGAGLFAGRRDRPLREGPLTGRGGLTGTISVRERLTALPGMFLTGRGSVGQSTLLSNALGPRMWVSRLSTPTEVGNFNEINPKAGACLTAFDYSFQLFYFLPAGGVPSQRRLAVVYRAPNGQVLWTRITDIPVLTNDTNGWQLMTQPQGDVIFYSRSQGAFGANAFGLFVFRMGLDGLIYWKRQLYLRTPSQAAGQNGISQVLDATWHPSRDRLIFACLMGDVVPLYVLLNPYTGAYDSSYYLSGGTLLSGFTFGGNMTINAPLIKFDSRMILTGSKRAATPAYTWVVECDPFFTSVNAFYKYTDGTALVFDSSAVLHADNSVTIMGAFSGAYVFLQLAPDLTIRRRVTALPGANGQSGVQLVTDANGGLHLGEGGGFYSRDYEGDITYRELNLASNNSGLPGRIDEASTRRPGPWFKMSTRWGVVSTSGQGTGAGLGNLTIGFELDMAPTTVSGTGYSITIGTRQESRCATQVVPAIVERKSEVFDGGVGPVFFFSPVIELNTGTPSWNPVFLDASTLLTYEYQASAIRRGVSSGFPALVTKPDPAIEPDPLKPYVSLHLPGTGVADSTFFTDYSNFNHQAIPLGNVRYSIEQAKFPDLGGFFERTSIRFDGEEDAIVYNPSPGFRFGAQPFTIEAWVYPTAWNRMLFDNSPIGDPAAHNNSFYVYLDPSGYPFLYALGGIRINFTLNHFNQPLPIGVWTHLAICREDQLWRIYVNGKTQSSSWRYDLDLSAGALLIGRACFPLNVGFGGSLPNFAGYMQEIRITQGVARYHRNFQPRRAPIQYVPAGAPLSLPAGTEPAESGSPTTDLNFNETLLFARMNGSSNVFFDDGPYAHSLVPYGNAQQLAGGKWAGNHGVFDAFGDYIDVVTSPALALGAGDFTIELWATRIGEGQGPETFQYLIDSRTAEPSAQIALRVNRVATGRQLALYANGAIRILGVPMVTSTRYHIALVRRSGVFTLYMNGVPVGSPWGNATNYTATTWTIARARFPDGGGDMGHFHGNLNDVRILRKALYTGSFTPPIAPWAGPPTANARYWRLFDFRSSFSLGGFSEYALSELALHRGRNRLPGTTASSSPVPSSGLLTNTQDLSVTINCNWLRSSMEQLGAFIQLDAGASVDADALRLAIAGSVPSMPTGFSLSHSNDGTTFSTLGHVTGIAPTAGQLTQRLAFLPLPTDPGDANFDKVVLRLQAESPGTSAIDTGPRGLVVINSNVSKSTAQAFEGSQSFLFGAGSDAYLTLGESANRSTFFSFGTGALTVEMAIYPLTVPPTNAVLFCTNAIGDAASYTNGFMWVLTNQMKLDLYVNGAYRGSTDAALPLGAWSEIRLTRNLNGLWRHAINGTANGTPFVNNVALTNRSFTIGRTGANGAELLLYNGYMDAIRVTRGLSRGDTSPVRALNGALGGQGRLVGSTLLSG